MHPGRLYGSVHSTAGQGHAGGEGGKQEEDHKVEQVGRGLHQPQQPQVLMPNTHGDRGAWSAIV